MIASYKVSKVTKAKKNGGLGLKKLDYCNSALLLKWVSRYTVEPFALWRRIVDSLHCTKRKWGIMPINGRISGTWKNIVKHGCNTKVESRTLHDCLKGKLGNGTSIRFWIDVWCGDEAFKDKFPNLFKIEKNKLVTVADRLASLKDGSCGWNQREENFTESMKKDLTVCLRMVEDFHCTDRLDEWTWTIDNSGLFSVKATKNWLQKEAEDNTGFALEWCKWIPAKVNIFVWRAELDRIATTSALERRNIMVPNKNCVFCDDFIETTEHLFSGCIFSSGVWLAIASWCGVPNLFAFSIRDVVTMHNLVGFKGIKKVAFHGVMYVAVWSIWRARNQCIFSDKKLKVMEVIAEIKSLSFLWFRSRYNKGSIDWNSWCKFDVM
ncbi:putative reverse transcriptase zinc-binding domain-containing protein [Helianthus annuus]|nr:putative reverse transcriptase zinc-binding domain-containing protein [Helianthus annuus]